MLTLADFDYHLPEDRIALHPVSPRDASRLLLVRPGEEPELADHVFADLPSLLRPGDLLVFNNTRVIPARLIGTRLRDENRVGIEVLLLKRLASNVWSGFAKPGKRLKAGDRVIFGGYRRAGGRGELSGTIAAKGQDGIVEIAFDQDGSSLDEAIARVGEMPLPPYILEARRRSGEASAPTDADNYQTVFAERDGAVAAPTASLHFTPELIARLDAAGIRHTVVTLHVGVGTFLPVKEAEIDRHRMHAEWGEIREPATFAINTTREAGGRVVAVGTTACRLLESAVNAEGLVRPFLGETEIFLRPGSAFRATDLLITNFHLPKSTLLMLVSAFSGLETMRRAYAHAIETGYRFFSYGDACLLWPNRLSRRGAPPGMTGDSA